MSGFSGPESLFIASGLSSSRDTFSTPQFFFSSFLFRILPLEEIFEDSDALSYICAYWHEIRERERKKEKDQKKNREERKKGGPGGAALRDLHNYTDRG